MEINKELKRNKTELLAYFRSRACEILSELALNYAPTDFKKKASALNKAIIQCKENFLLLYTNAQELSIGLIRNCLKAC